MTEADFWVSLEYRVCKEFAGMAERRLQYFGCDGFVPEDYQLSGPRPHIKGRAWMDTDCTRQAEWVFTLVLPTGVRSREEVDWAALLPAEGVAGWLAWDEGERFLRMGPAVAVPAPAG